MDLEDSQNTETPTTTEVAALPDDPLTLLRKQNLAMIYNKIVDRWPRRNFRHHELQTLLMQATEDHKKVNFNPDHLITRRDAFHFLALLPLEIAGLSALGSKPKASPEEILTQCAAGVMGCWYMVRGHKVFTDYIVRSKELAAASDAVSAYIPVLTEIADSSSTQHSKAASDLLVQCFLLKASIARDIKGTNEGIYYTHQAEKYSSNATNPMLRVLALRTLSSVYAYTNHWGLALQTAEEAQQIVEDAEKEREGTILYFVQSYLYSGLATYQGRMGQVQNALTSIGKAHEALERSKKEMKPIWVDHSPVNLLLNDGVAQLHLGLFAEAIASFEKTNELPRGGIGDAEILINEVMAEVQREDQRDMEWCMNRWTRGITKAVALQSDQWYNEACTAYMAMRAAWPTEQRIKELRDHIVHW